MPIDLGTKLAFADIALTIVGFGITVAVALRAKTAAQAAEAASKNASEKILKADLHGEVGAVLHLVSELKRLQRNKTIDLLPDRYSELRMRIVAMRESTLIGGEEDLAAIQDAVVRLTALEKMILQDPAIFDNAKQLAKSNQSLSLCSDAMLALRERIRIK